MKRLTSNTLNQKPSNKDLKSLLEFLVYYSEAQTNYITGGKKQLQTEVLCEYRLKILSKAQASGHM